MNDTQRYAVFLFPQAQEALGDAIKPYLSDAPAGQHILCAGACSHDSEWARSESCE